MPSEVSICNQALGWLGGNLITSLDDKTTEANLCKANYDGLRRAVLEELPWRFAVSRNIPSKLAEVPEFEYSSKFQLPVDLIRLTSVFTMDEGHSVLDWEMEGDTVLCNEDSIAIKYIKDIEDVFIFSAGFTQALAARLAVDLAIPLTESRSLQADMAKLYTDKLNGAITLNSMQGQQEHFVSNQYTRVR